MNTEDCQDWNQCLMIKSVGCDGLDMLNERMIMIGSYVVS